MAKASSQKPTVEELYFRSDSAYLCLLLNRRTRSIRVIDFRAGALPAKRLYIQSIATKENVEKVITLVEKDEVSSWTKVGFVREGTIPGFYKRSDGHLCGCVIGDRTASLEISEEGQKLAERTINGGKKAMKDIPDIIRNVTTVPIEEGPALSARDAAWKKGFAIGCFDSFGRDAQRQFVQATHKKGAKNFLSAEYQECFGHSLIEILRSPETDDELVATTAGLRDLSEELRARGIVSAFSFAPSDDQQLATAFLSAGYRKTGLLADGALSGNGRKDAILWTRKLANPGGEEEI